MIVEVTWEDASFRESILTLEQVEADEPYIVKSVGWMVKRDKHRIRIAMNTISDGRVRDLLVIPMAMVKKIRRLR